MYSIYPNYESLCEKRRFHATKRLLLLYVYMFIERSHKIKDNFPKYVVSLDEFNMSQNGIKHRNIRDFLLTNEWN